MGKILHVNLTHSEINIISTREYADPFLGGRGIASRIYWETVKPGVNAFDPENVIILMTGPLVGTGAQAATRMAIVGKSPMALPEGYCYGNLGGYFGVGLKRAGFDGVVIEGRAPAPVYLLVQDTEATIWDASSIWGQGAYRTGEILQETHGKKTYFLTTGMAGEKMVRTAVIVGSHHSTSSAGFGAVMGSKNLKALVAGGTRKPVVDNHDRLKELNRYTARISKRLRLSMPPAVLGTGHDHLLEVIGKGGCHQCGLECIRGLYRFGQQLEGYRKCQSMEYYLPWRYGQENESVETFFDAPTLANDAAIDTWELGNMVDWLYACHRSGVLTEQETGLPLSNIGTREFLEKLLHIISYREGFGDILAEGLARIRSKVPDRAQELISPFVTAIGTHDLFPPRVFVAHSLLYSMEPRVHHLLLHEIGFVYVAWALTRLQPGLTPVTTEVFYSVANAFWGSEQAADLSSYEGKALAVQKIQDRCFIKDSLGLCDFAYPITYSFNTPDHVGDPDLEGKMFTAVTSIPAEELEGYAERICNLQRRIMVREGFNTPEADFPPAYNFDEPIQGIPNFGLTIVPGPEGGVVDVKGKVLYRDRFTNMLKEYYRLRGWQEESGRPKPEAGFGSMGLENING